jgi:acetyl esterase/lipase
MDIADGKAAIEYVRSHADEFGISQNKIGIMGFSAGNSSLFLL